jgi:hypothetical protein
MKPTSAALLGLLGGLAIATVVSGLLASYRLGQSEVDAVSVGVAKRDDTHEAPVLTSDRAPVESAVPAPAAKVLRTEPAVAATDDSLGILIYGTVHDEKGRPIDTEMGQVEFAPATGDSLWAYIASGTYARLGLSPGTWTVRTGLRHFRPTSQVLTLSANEPLVRLDIVEIASHRIVVRVFAPDGRPIDEAAPEDFPQGDAPSEELGVIASREPLTSAPQLDQRLWDSWDVGHFWLRADIGAYLSQVSMPDDCLGLLEVDVPSVVWVHLMFGSALLASQQVAADATDIAFTIDPAQLSRNLGSFSVRCLDAKTGAPIAGASAQLRTADSWRDGAPTGPDGRWHKERVQPGRYIFTASTRTSEHLSFDVIIPPGSAVDLGDIALKPAVRLAGTIVDADGHGVATSLRLRCLDQEGAWPVGVEFEYGQSSALGTFAFEGLGPRRYVLTVVDEQLPRHVVPVDLTGGDVTGLRIAVGIGVSVTVQPDWPAQESHGLRLLDSNGFTVGEARSWSGDKPFVRRLEAGRYTAVVFGDGGVERQRTFEVGGTDLVVRLGL